VVRGIDGYELGALALTGAYNVAVNRHLPSASHLPANLATSGALLALARAAGVAPGELGLAAGDLLPGARIGLLTAAASAGAIAAGIAFRPTRPFFVDDRVREHSRLELAYHALVRIPIATALGEELVFRSALLGLFARGRSERAAVAISSTLFGLWHVLPTLASLDHEGTTWHRNTRRIPAVVGVVGVTAATGIAFARLRLRSRSVLAPVLVHAALNVTALVAARLVSRPSPSAMRA
jgi:membrane protease YdiL (CAAX protease family)